MDSASASAPLRLPFVIRIIGLGSSVDSTPFDNQFLKEYDPERDGIDAWGRTMDAHVVTTPNVREAIRFKDQLDAWEFYRQVCKRRPRRRPDRKPNRPLTAFTVSVELAYD